MIRTISFVTIVVDVVVVIVIVVVVSFVDVRMQMAIPTSAATRSWHHVYWF